MKYEEFKTKFGFQLNEQQEAALREIEGQSLLLAVPGSGKTTTLVWRLGYMIYVKGIEPSTILTITFSVAAAADIRKRFVSVFGEEYASRLDIRTINSLCDRLCYVFSERYGRPKPKLIKEPDNYSLIRKAYSKVCLDWLTESDVKDLALGVALVKNGMLDDEEIGKLRPEDEYFPEFYKEYKALLKSKDRMDYDDQLVFAHSILTFTRDTSFRDELQRRYKYILVDEAQDTSKIQHAIIDILAEKHGNLFMVGDEDQSIYGFRAAFPEELLRFEQKYPRATILKIEENFRSTKEIVRLADACIKRNKKRYDKNMVTGNEQGDLPRFIRLQKREDQYDEIVNRLLPGIDGEVAIIYRNNSSAIPLIARMMDKNIDFKCRNMDALLFDNSVVSNIRKIFELAFDPYNVELFMDTYSRFNARISKEEARKAVSFCEADVHRSIWDALAELPDLSRNKKSQVSDIALGLHTIAKRNNVRDAFLKLYSGMGYAKADDDKAVIFRMLADRDETIQEFLERMDYLRDDIENHIGSPDARITLSTVHGSKGLEYDNVIIIDEIYGIFPDPEADIEEERRLFYVALTRAKKNLYLMEYRGKMQTFIEECRDFYRKEEERKGPKVDTSMFRCGLAVEHNSFGKGVITYVDNKKLKIRFDRDRIERAFDKEICASKGFVKLI